MFSATSRVTNVNSANISLTPINFSFTKKTIFQFWVISPAQASIFYRFQNISTGFTLENLSSTGEIVMLDPSHRIQIYSSSIWPNSVINYVTFEV